jgi:CheY-like chemotaxis protein
VDLALPDIDGWEVCRRLKTDGGSEGIPIVILTARDEARGWRAGRSSNRFSDRRPYPDE